MTSRTLLIHTLQVYFTCTASLQYVCHPGNYLHTPRVGPDICLPCPDGVSFMPESLHINRQCYNCTQVLDPSVEVAVSVCNRTHDSVILCRDGFYRRVARNVRELDMCVQCSVCDHVTRPCQGYHDAVCCLPSYYFVSNGVSFECQEHFECGAGEFLSLKTEQCTPCPSDAFMALDKHNQTKCQVCQTLDNVGPYQEIVQPCNKTHPTQFACRDGFYRNTSIELKEANTNCVPCRTCEFKGGVCQKSPSLSLELNCLFIDKITETTSMKNSTGEPVSSPSPVCGQNKCLSTRADTNASICLPCPDETHSHDLNDTRLLSKSETSKVEDETPSLQLVLPFIILMISFSITTFIILACMRISRAVTNKDCSPARTDHKILKKVTLVYFFIFVNLSLLMSAFCLSSVSRMLAWINIVIFEVLFALIVSVLYTKTKKINNAFRKVKLYSPQVTNEFSAKAQIENKEIEDLVKNLNTLI